LFVCLFVCLFSISFPFPPSFQSSQWIFQRMASPQPFPLPPEVCMIIVGFLPATDVATLARVCRLFRMLCKDESLWKRFCHRHDLHGGLEPTGFTTYFELYCRILRNHGSLLGLWRTDQARPKAPPSGGLFHCGVRERDVHLWRLIPTRVGMDLGEDEWRISDSGFTKNLVWQGSSPKESAGPHPSTCL